MAESKTDPKTPAKKGFRIEDETKRSHNSPVPRAQIQRRIVNPRGNRKGR